MRSLRIIAFGDVQGVGYRQFVWKIATKLGIVGTVKNLDDGTVEVIAQGENGKMDEFLAKINAHEYPINVEKLEIAEIPPQDFRRFKIIRGDPTDELGERLDVAGKYMYKMMRLQELTLQKQDQMLQKQDTTISAINNLSNTMSQKFDALDVKYGSISENLEKINHTSEKLIEKLS